MITIDPCGADIYLKYKCPCGAEYSVTIDETKYPGGALCYCGQKLKYKPIERVKIGIVFTKKIVPQVKCPTQSKPISDSPCESANISEDCVNALISLGYKKRQAIELTEKILKQRRCSTVQEFIIEVNKK